MQGRRTVNIRPSRLLALAIYRVNERAGKLAWRRMVREWVVGGDWWGVFFAFAGPLSSIEFSRLVVVDDRGRGPACRVLFWKKVAGLTRLGTRKLGSRRANLPSSPRSVGDRGDGRRCERRLAPYASALPFHSCQISAIPILLTLQGCGPKSNERELPSIPDHPRGPTDKAWRDLKRQE